MAYHKPRPLIDLPAIEARLAAAEEIPLRPEMRALLGDLRRLMTANAELQQQRDAAVADAEIAREVGSKNAAMCERITGLYLDLTDSMELKEKLKRNVREAANA